MYHLRETLKEAGYTHERTLGHGEHLLRSESGTLEVWACSKNHAGYALRYGNTHLEFCRSYPYNLEEYSCF